MSGVKPVDVHSIKEGRYIVMEGVPCIVKSIKSSAPGKHGHAKFRIEAVGIFDNKKRVEVKSGHTRCEVPVIEKKSGQVLSIANNKVQIMDMETYETMELPVPEEEDLKNKVKPGVEVTYWDVMGTKQIKGLK
ncbi:translation initiation factor IF-5A [archaeon CG_4_10_14_0_2_um_filter_Archaea_38_6]|nr:MAG: translation initiation factor IF-5A [archaeon CG07_land_8_20_14_0_80_38_8]PIU88693.1 MAG: translation initiation factor IF-5A [archaeon CG06_land_8_20_14_3_00_37_11]PIX42605.1 MAG: translation initiation factor IF-5A [archaeon CG_4_8_14_3_um_filter_38_5]PJA22892.1 MAG: translation initiation factor IF-5A [archaeon CG_4_10_14_0_2_um_filter_Archaea_38_6]